MTKSLEAAFAAASKLSEAEQDVLAAAIQAEIEADPKWARSFAESEAELEQLANEALNEHRSDQAQPEEGAS